MKPPGGNFSRPVSVSKKCFRPLNKFLELCSKNF